MERETRDLKTKFKKLLAEKQALELEIKDQKAKLILSEKVADENNARKDEEIKQLRAMMHEQK
jgi:regulator of replication initiation timing